jgi:hypothetical protein
MPASVVDAPALLPYEVASIFLKKIAARATMSS